MKNKSIILSSDQSLLELYNDMPVAKAIVQIVPGIGTFLNEILANKGGKIKEQRLESFLNALYDCIKVLDETTLKKEWVNTEEFYDFFQRAINSSLKTRSREKIKLNALILSNVISISNIGRYRPEEYLSALEDLTPLEVSALVAIYEKFQATPRSEEENDLQHAKRINWQEAILQKCGIDNEDIDFIVKRLERTGFIAELTGMYLGYDGGQIKLTESFKRFVEYLSMHPFNN